LRGRTGEQPRHGEAARHIARVCAETLFIRAAGNKLTTAQTSTAETDLKTKQNLQAKLDELSKLDDKSDPTGEKRRSLQETILVGLGKDPRADKYQVIDNPTGEKDPVTVKAMQYDPQKDLQPIALVGQVPFLLVASPAFAPSTVAELAAYAKANPDKVNYSSFGNNTSSHLAGELFKVTAGIRTTHVPYKGSGPSIIDVMGGQIQYTFDAPAAVLAQVQAGKLKAIAVATNRRLASAPTVPTMAEAGMPGVIGGTWFGLLVPAKTPRAVIDRINAATLAALNAADFRKTFEDRSIAPGGGTPEDFGRFIAGEITKWQQLAATVGIKPE